MAAAIGLGELQSVVTASDAAATSLATATANVAINGLAIAVRKLDWGDDEDLAAAVSANGGPFDLVLGAALQFEKWEKRLPAALAALTHAGRRGRRSIVAFAHTAGASAATVEGSGARFEQLERSSGLAHGLHTRWSEAESDFEVVVLGRTR